MRIRIKQLKLKRVHADPDLKTWAKMKDFKDFHVLGRAGSSLEIQRLLWRLQQETLKKRPIKKYSKLNLRF